MALLTTNSKYALKQLPMPVCQGAETVTVRMIHTLAATMIANDVAWLGDLPPGHIPTEVTLDSTDIDTNGAPTVTISVGILNAGKTDLATTWIAAATSGQAGGYARPASTSAFYSTAVSSSAQSIGLKFPAIPATFAAGVVGVTLSYRHAHGNQ